MVMMMILAIISTTGTIKFVFGTYSDTVKYWEALRALAFQSPLDSTPGGTMMIVPEASKRRNWTQSVPFVQLRYQAILNSQPMPSNPIELQRLANQVHLSVESLRRYYQPDEDFETIINASPWDTHSRSLLSLRSNSNNNLINEQATRRRKRKRTAAVASESKRLSKRTRHSEDDSELASRVHREDLQEEYAEDDDEYLGLSMDDSNQVSNRRSSASNRSRSKSKLSTTTGNTTATTSVSRSKQAQRSPTLPTTAPASAATSLTTRSRVRFKWSSENDQLLLRFYIQYQTNLKRELLDRYGTRRDRGDDEDISDDAIVCIISLFDR